MNKVAKACVVLFAACCLGMIGVIVAGLWIDGPWLADNGWRIVVTLHALQWVAVITLFGALFMFDDDRP